MKVIRRQNAYPKKVDESIVCEGVDESYAKLIADLLNNKLSSPDSMWFYVAVQDDHTLYKYNPLEDI